MTGTKRKRGDEPVIVIMVLISWHPHGMLLESFQKVYNVGFRVIIED